MSKRKISEADLVFVDRKTDEMLEWADKNWDMVINAERLMKKSKPKIANDKKIWFKIGAAHAILHYLVLQKDVSPGGTFFEDE